MSFWLEILVGIVCLKILFGDATISVRIYNAGTSSYFQTPEEAEKIKRERNAG